MEQRVSRSKHGKDFFEAKERLGLLSVGDPGTGDKVQVTDTFIVSLARKADRSIKKYPEVKRTLGSVRRRVRNGKILAGKVIQKTRSARTVNTSAKERTISLDDIHLPEIKKPLVSIVIPAFNKVAFTRSCLYSLAQNISPEIPYEVILVDNGSDDDTKDFNKLKNLVYLRNRENLGFVGGCNSGAQKAKGKYLVFLNNDTEVTSSWLKWLYETINSDEHVGIVGSKIVYPNGVLQEAGGIIFSDADGLNYGKFDQADAYQYNYVRDVDYCSGASIIIRKKLFDQLDGFDKLYQPAYYEDTDLCFKVRSKGLRVLYQPRSVLYHIEGGTAGTNTSSGFKKYQVINKEKFIKRWGKELKTSHHQSDDYYLGRDRSGDKLALIIEEAVPTPDKDSGSVRMVAMIKGLQSLGYKVTFWPNNLTPLQPYTESLQALGVEVVYGNIDFMQFSKHYAHYYNLVIMSRPEICAKYINICRSLFVNAKLIYDTVDLHYIRLARQAAIEKRDAHRLNEQSKWYEILEKGLMERTDTTLVVSPKEVEILRTEGVKHDIQVLSNIHTLNESSYNNTFNDRSDIIFVGNYAHLPNIDAVSWFVKDIFPKIRNTITDAKLHIVGANMPETLKSELAGKNIVIHGFVDDQPLHQLLQRARVFVAPLRYGAGVKGKIGQSIEHGLPIVSTSIGAEGMYLQDGLSCLVADDADSFIASVVSLYEDKKLWDKVRMNAKKALVEHFSPEVAIRNLREILK